ncbi:MAG: TRAP transporter substrate-binding protein [Dehalococcoidales bacterium]|nr:TRAP transporter substrate-binding protein [Dehalococcoidales bacterium]
MITQRRFRSVINLCLVVLVAASLFLVACSKQAVTTTPAQTPAATTPKPTTPSATTSVATTPVVTKPAATVEIKKTTFTYGHYFAPGDFRDVCAHYYADMLTEDSNGMITVKIYPAEQLIKGLESVPSVAAGVVDFTMANGGYVDGEVPVIGLWSLPFTPHDDEGSIKILREGWDLVDPEFTKKNIKLLGAICSTGPSEVFFTKPVRTLADIAGTKVRVNGAIPQEAMRALGFSVVNMAASEQYMALQTKMVQGVNTTYLSVMGYKLYEQVSYWLRIDMGGSNPYYSLMNLKKWDAQSPQVQQILQDAANKTEKWMIVELKKTVETQRDEIRKMMKEEIQLSSDEYSKWKAKLTFFDDRFAEANGALGKAMLEIRNKIDATYLK